jgi:ABC-type multidrug transport system ATPase subunit
MKEWLSRVISQGRTVFMTTHVLENVERLCDRVAIIKSPGHLLWEGDITSLADNQPIIHGNREFHTLEELYLQVSGGRSTISLNWI